MSIAKINEVTKANSQRVCGVVASSAAGGLLGIANINGAVAQPAFSTDYSIDLNGSTQYVNLSNVTGTAINPTSTQINATGYTFTAWIYIDTLSGGEYIYNLGSSGTNNYYGLKLVANGNGALVWHIFGLNGSTPGAGTNNRNSVRTQNSTIAAGQWYHVAAVIPSMTRSGWKLYVNGVSQSSLVVSGNQNVNLTYSGSSSIGVWTKASPANYFDGEINNAAIFDTDLNQTNMTAIYNSGTPINLLTNAGNYNTSGNLVAWWRFNEGTGTVYEDSSDEGLFEGEGVGTPGWSTNVP